MCYKYCLLEPAQDIAQYHLLTNKTVFSINKACVIFSSNFSLKFTGAIIKLF